MDFDVIVVGGGAAGLSAAVAAAGLGKKTLVYSGAGSHTSALYKAELVDNYLGIPNITGAELTDKFVAHAKNAGVEIKKGRVLQILKSEEGFFVQAESDTLTAANIVLALGVTRKPAIKGEEMFLGKGVSYCAACDGMLYRRKKVAVIAEIAEAEEEYEYLKNICGETEYFPVYDTGEKILEITGEESVTGIVTENKEVEVQGVFIFRGTVPAESLIYGIKTENGIIITDKSTQTNIEGVFACGDCTGKPYQVAKAVGEGLVAGQAAARRKLQK